MLHHALEGNKKETNKRGACGLLTHGNVGLTVGFTVGLTVVGLTVVGLTVGLAVVGLAVVGLTVGLAVVGDFVGDFVGVSVGGDGLLVGTGVAGGL